MAQEINTIKLLVVIAGPTAVGKTALGVALAKTFNTDVISADSRQFYKELSIGTAKPTTEEMQGIFHHFVDSHTINTPYNVGDYEIDVINLLKQLFVTKNVVFLVGGSGLFVKAITEGLDIFPDIDPEIRNQLNNDYELHGLEPLLKELAEKDPEYFQMVDNANPQRVIRALEVIRSTGQPFSSFRTNQPKLRPFAILKIGVEMERELLYQRINARMDAMLQDGLLTEVSHLQQYRSLIALKTVGYEEIFDFLDGNEDWEQTVMLLKRNSRRYAKRQMTWFKKDKDFTWFGNNQIEEIEALIIVKLKNNGS